MWWLFACTLFAESPVARDIAPAEPAPVAPPLWPDPAALRSLPPRAVAGTLLLDAGHGAPKNSGNRNYRCEAEADVMLRVSQGISAALTRAAGDPPVPPGLLVTPTRPDAGLVAYPDRLSLADRHAGTSTPAWLISLHSDTRAGQNPVADPVTGCVSTSGAQGFSVLWSDEGPGELVAGRRRLAEALATRMIEAGFPAYPGLDYGGLYEAGAVPGAFVDRHTPKKRIMLLRRPKIPSVILETHEAWDPLEAKAWEQPATWSAAASAIRAALADTQVSEGKSSKVTNPPAAPAGGA